MKSSLKNWVSGFDINTITYLWRIHLMYLDVSFKSYRPNNEKECSQKCLATNHTMDIFHCTVTNFISSELMLRIVLQATTRLTIGSVKDKIYQVSLSGTDWYSGMDSSIRLHYNDIMVGAVAFQIASLTIVYSSVYSEADQRKRQSSASLTFVRGIHR